MRSNESSEDYLETILILGNRSSLVRAVDIAAEMGFKKPSVSVAMKNLRQKNLITVADNGDIPPLVTSNPFSKQSSITVDRKAVGK